MSDTQSSTIDNQSSTTPIGVTFASFSALGPQAGLRAAARAVELGYSSFWVAETVGMEAFATLAAIGAAQPALSLGTGVLALQLRTPAVTAMGAATLQALHPDRDILLGVGISSPAVVSRWHGAQYGDRPLAQTREYLTLVRECLSGEKVTFQGDFYQVKGFRLGVDPGERRPRIILAALNPRMLELAGELADGGQGDGPPPAPGPGRAGQRPEPLGGPAPTAAPPRGW
jgi:alkanesulfonate monooxygenase SsuD/methylene tetrahydromethanopterin reductase-like flavin-dependent oxidoreductase (luciferase family)